MYSNKNETEWINIVQIKDTLERKMYKAKLHAGEVDVMILAQEEPRSDLVIIDDNAAKKTAKYLGLNVTGTLGVLIKAKKIGLIPSVFSILETMQANGFYISEKIFNMVLEQVGEKYE